MKLKVKAPSTGTRGKGKAMEDHKPLLHDAYRVDYPRSATVARERETGRLFGSRI